MAILAELTHAPTVLLVEDDEATSQLESRALKRQGYNVAAVETVQEAIAALDNMLVDVMLLDYNLPGGDAWSVLQHAREKDPRIPVILVTGMGDEQVASQAFRLGASEYVIKRGDFWQQLPTAVDQALRLSRAEEALRRSERTQSAILGAMPAHVALLDRTGQIIAINEPWKAFMDGRGANLPRHGLGMNCLDNREQITGASGANGVRLSDGIRRVLSGAEDRHSTEYECLISGKRVWFRGIVAQVRERETFGAVVMLVDITQHRSLEEQLLESQKMEAVGRLAGGIAHDFNNLLTIIKGYGESLLETVRDESGAEDAKEVLRAADSAANLTRQLLAFARRQVLQPEVMDLNECVTGVKRMLGRIIGEDVQVVAELSSALKPIEADPGQIEQVLLNLAVNARDAMPKGGTLRLGTTNVAVSPGTEVSASGDPLAPGDYVMLCVSDTGEGMTPDVRERIFEPFYTTKGKEGKGTGLGLSTVFGIVTQSGGRIEVDSAPGAGATFRIYFPAASAPVAVKRAAPPPATTPKGTETIVVVEDNEMVRKLIMRFLVPQGYRVHAASTGLEALRVLDEIGGAADVLLTDVVMPDLSGPDLAAEVAAKYPGIRTIFMSGYSDETVSVRSSLRPGVPYIAKPFTNAVLLTKIREVLQGPA